MLSRREIMAPGVRAPLAPSGRADAVAAIGTIDVAGASLPLGSMLAAVKQLWPLPRSGATVTGRLYRRDEALTLTVHMRRSRKTAPHEFTVTVRPGDTWESYNDLVASAASRLAYELSLGDKGISNDGFPPSHPRARALHAHEWALSRDPDNSYALDGMGKAMLALGDLAGARKMHEAAQKINPADAYAPHGVADVLMACGDYDGSIAANEQALRVDKLAAYALNGIGDAYERKRCYPEAEQRFGTTLATAGDDVAAAAYAHDGLARAAFAQGRFPPALEHAQKGAGRTSGKATSPRPPRPTARR
ncbi:hypothetical protein AB0J83_30160 [Actinoplanes sp. NPDC049596]|uniref:tetratricopeptide repeat protein n=1 Tax=unclassified Actinoplanes TaxID=2626549 RepID=UPI00343A4AE0